MIRKKHIYKNLSEIPFNPKAFIVDIWGVLWDGIEAYDSAINCLKEIKIKKIPVVLLSNAPRRSYTVVQRLKTIGIAPNLYDFILSSGESCHNSFANNLAPTKNLGEKFFFLGLEDDKGLLENLPYKEEKDINKADFVLLVGARDLKHKISNYHDELKNFLSLKLPLVCVNPDRVVVRKNGETLICAGELALYYKNLGGEVIFFGKPYQHIYEECLKKIKSIDATITLKDILIIGDSLETDILGANRSNIKSTLILNGIHSREITISPLKRTYSIKKLNILYKKFNAKPDYSIDTFN